MLFKFSCYLGAIECQWIEPVKYFSFSFPCTVRKAIYRPCSPDVHYLLGWLFLFPWGYEQLQALLVYYIIKYICLPMLNYHLCLSVFRVSKTMYCVIFLFFLRVCTVSYMAWCVLPWIDTDLQDTSSSQDPCKQNKCL